MKKSTFFLGTVLTVVACAESTSKANDAGVELSQNSNSSRADDRSKDGNDASVVAPDAGSTASRDAGRKAESEDALVEPPIEPVGTGTPLQLDQTSPLGFSAQDAASEYDGAYAGTLEYEDGSRAALTIEVKANGYAVYNPRPDAPGAKAEFDTVKGKDAVIFSVDIEFATDDGEFAEKLTGTIAAFGDQTAIVGAAQKGTRMVGSHAVPLGAGSEPDGAVEFLISLTEEGTTTGSVLDRYSVHRDADLVVTRATVGTW